ncbi:MAG: DUF2817 domain-containing protein, partial [Armatimonadota bacterium]
MAEVRIIGKSATGRPLFAVLVTEKCNDARQLSRRPRLLVISGQHGDEITPAAAVVDVMEMLAAGRPHSRLIRKAVFLFVPAANPDGLAAGSRTNSSGVDLNRDWKLQSQPETASVAGLAMRFKPDVVLDMHEWTTCDRRASNCIEIPGDKITLAQRLSRAIACSITTDSTRTPVHLSTVRYAPNADERLLHRWVAARGISAMLVETTRRSSLQYRKATYMQAVLRTA